MTTSLGKKRNSPQRHIRISTNLNELHATDNASRARYVKTMGVQGIVVQVPCIVVKKIQIHRGLKSKIFVPVVVPVRIRSAALLARFKARSHGSKNNVV